MTPSGRHPKNVAYKLIGRICVCYYNALEPTDQEHRESIQFFRKLDFSYVRVLAISEGGAPTTLQRKDFNDIVAGRSIPLALLTDSVLVRGVVTAYSWFNRSIRAFSSDDIQDALAYLEVEEPQYEKFEAEIRLLQEQVNGRRR
jgi:hypothetical protein